MRIVGVAVFPLFALIGMPSTDLGTGAAVSTPLLSAQSSLQPGFGCNEHVTCHNFFLIRYKPGTDLNAAATRVTRAVTAAGGMLAGRWSWELFAGATGVTGQAVIPVPLVLLAVPATLLLANLTATGPGWTAAHASAALILSSE
jgi:hypothetical protein